jgi:ribosome biogenesis GTPase / thiamine phosphate phosphatase
LSTQDSAGGIRGVVTLGTGGIWRVRLDSGEEVESVLRGKLKQESAFAIKLAVGDDVIVERDERGSAWAISEILPRRTALARRAPGGAAGERVLVANVDQVVVVFAAANPEPHPRMLDRFLIIAEANDLRACIVLNKIDLVPANSARERFSLYEQIGYDVFYTSVKRGDDLSRFHDAITGRTSALSGPSGVGKSSLLNAIYPDAGLRVGEISMSVNKGRHTTVGARLLPLPDGGFVADTPGLREIGVWGLQAGDLDSCFPEMRPYIVECRFKDCAHIAEPGCAVREALREGKVPVVRYDSYVKLRGELDDVAPRY